MATSVNGPDIANGGRAWPFVGRAEVVQRIASAIANSRSSTVLVHGTSGVGKTRSTVEAGRLLSASGWAVIPVQGSSALSSTPLGALAPHLASDPIGATGTDKDASALMATAIAAIEDIVGSRRGVVLVDDITLIDQLTLSVVAQLLQSRKVKLIATVREGDPLPDALLALWTRDEALRLDLAPLTLEQTGELLRVYLGDQVSLRTAAAFTDASRGIPLYIRELVSTAAANGTLVNREGSWQVIDELPTTPALRELVLARLRTVPATGRDVLNRLALCETLSIDDFAAPDAIDVLTDLERLGLIDVDDSEGSIAVQLAHPQHGPILRDAMPRMQVVQLLREQAGILAARSVEGKLSGPDAVRHAAWMLDSGQPSNPGLLAAGARLARHANDMPQVIRLGRAAVQAGSDDASIHSLLGEALRAAGRTDEALVSFDRALDQARAEGDIATLVDAGIQKAMTLADRPGGSVTGLDVLDGLEREAPGMPQITGVRALLLVSSELAAAALTMVEGAPASLGSDLSTVLPLAAVGRTADAITAAERLRAHAATASVAEAVIDARSADFLAASVLMSDGQPLASIDLARRSLVAAIAMDDAVFSRHAEFALAVAHLEMGHLRAARRWLLDVVSGAETHGPPSYRDQGLGSLALVQVWRGELDAATRTLSRLPAETVQRDIGAYLARGWLLYLRGEPEAARDLLQAKAHEYEKVGHAVLESLVLFTIARLGGSEAAVARLNQLEARTQSGLIGMRSRHAQALKSADAGELEALAEEWERRGFVLYAAEALATASRASSAAGDGRRAARLAHAASQLTSQTEGADLPSLRLTAGSEVLTARENEIAVLASTGLSSAAIATQLFLSVRTIENHLQSVYRKLSISGRAELAGSL